MRVGTAENTTWNVNDQDPTTEAAFQLQAKQEGAAGDAITIAVNAVNYTGAAGVAVANPTATVTAASGTLLTVNNAAGFQPNDTITDGTKNATITAINYTTNVLTVSVPLTGTTLRIADISPANPFPFRTAATTALYAGTVAKLVDPTNTVTATQYVVIAKVDNAGFVTRRAALRWPIPIAWRRRSRRSSSPRSSSGSRHRRPPRRKPGTTYRSARFTLTMSSQPYNPPLTMCSPPRSRPSPQPIRMPWSPLPVPWPSRSTALATTRRRLPLPPMTLRSIV